MLVVQTIEDYANQLGMVIDWDDQGLENSIKEDERKILSNIIACEVAIYCMRRSVDADGSNIDDMCEIRRNFINQYEEYTKHKYKYFNEDL